MKVNYIAITTLKRFSLIMGTLLLFLSAQQVFSQEILWFSNTPPPSEKGIRPVGMHRYSGKKGKRGSSNIMQWLRRGDNLLESEYVHLADSNSYEFHLFSPEHKDGTGKFINSKNAFLSFPSKGEGYFNAYLIHKKISNDTLYIQVAKADMLNHSCRNGHKNVRTKIGPYTYPNIIPAEVVRLRDSRENFHYFAKSGDVVDYKMILNGKPVENASITYITQTNWRNTQKTNSEGIAQFQLIQDYFTNWQELNNRKVYYYLVVAQFTLAEKGEYQGQHYNYIHYTSTMSDGYRPASTMYKSMFWAFVIFIVTLILSIAGIFIYRIRRNKVYKEVHFDE